MLAVAHAQRDEHAEAVAHLERAIALNPENRALARTDPDLDPLHDDEAFRAALETPSSSVRPIDRRRPFKTRTAR
jgi:Tetratricopeptide repeat